jgi:hypothetical protein
MKRKHDKKKKRKQEEDMYAVFLICVNPLLHVYVREKDGEKEEDHVLLGGSQKWLKNVFKYIYGNQK